MANRKITVPPLHAVHRQRLNCEIEILAECQSILYMMASSNLEQVDGGDIKKAIRGVLYLLGGTTENLQGVAND